MQYQGNGYEYECKSCGLNEIYDSDEDKLSAFKDWFKEALYMMLEDNKELPKWVVELGRF